MESVLIQAVDLEQFFQVTKGNMQNIFLVGIVIFGLVLLVSLLVKIFIRTVMSFFSPRAIDVTTLSDAGAKEYTSIRWGR